jgi:hypothetical protein
MHGQNHIKVEVTVHAVVKAEVQFIQQCNFIPMPRWQKCRNVFRDYAEK